MGMLKPGLVRRLQCTGIIQGLREMAIVIIKMPLLCSLQQIGHARTTGAIESLNPGYSPCISYHSTIKLHTLPDTMETQVIKLKFGGKEVYRRIWRRVCDQQVEYNS